MGRPSVRRVVLTPAVTGACCVLVEATLVVATGFFEANVCTGGSVVQPERIIAKPSKNERMNIPQYTDRPSLLMFCRDRTHAL